MPRHNLAAYTHDNHVKAASIKAGATIVVRKARMFGHLCSIHGQTQTIFKLWNSASICMTVVLVLRWRRSLPKRSRQTHSWREKPRVDVLKGPLSDTSALEKAVDSRRQHVQVPSRAENPSRQKNLQLFHIISDFSPRGEKRKTAEDPGTLSVKRSNRSGRDSIFSTCLVCSRA